MMWRLPIPKLYSFTDRRNLLPQKYPPHISSCSEYWYCWILLRPGHFYVKYTSGYNIQWIVTTCTASSIALLSQVRVTNTIINQFQMKFCLLAFILEFAARWGTFYLRRSALLPTTKPDAPHGTNRAQSGFVLSLSVRSDLQPTAPVSIGEVRFPGRYPRWPKNTFFAPVTHQCCYYFCSKQSQNSDSRYFNFSKAIHSPALLAVHFSHFYSRAFADYWPIWLRNSTKTSADFSWAVTENSTRR